MRKLLHIFIPFFLLPVFVFAQPLPELGASKKYVVFTAGGLINNTGNSYYRGNVGTNFGTVSGFGNIDGSMQSGNAASQQASDDLNAAVDKIDSLNCTTNILNMTVSNTTFRKGVYCVTTDATLGDSIVLDAENDPDAVFVFKVQGFLTFLPNTRVFLVNGAQSCRVFWAADGIVGVGAGCSVKGNIIGGSPALNAVSIGAGVTLEGRVLTILGAIVLNSVDARIPVGCDLPDPKGPVSPNLKSVNCYALFGSSGNLTNAGTTNITGRIGSNTGTVSGFQPANVSQGIEVQSAGTQQAAIDLNQADTYISSLPNDAEITFPLLLGNGFYISPHVVLANSNTVLSGTLFLDAQDNPSSVFVIKVNGDFTAAPGSLVALVNGAKSCNVFWQVQGTVNINAGATFRGSLIASNNITVATGVTLDGRLLARIGNIGTTAFDAAIPAGCGGCPYSPVNNAPIALNDSRAMLEDGPVQTIPVLNNDTDPDGDSLVVTIISGSAHGNSGTNGISITYKPSANYYGGDTVIYRVCDNGSPSLCDTAYVYFSVAPVNDKPIAKDDEAYTGVNLPVQINVTVNDTDIEAQLLLVSLVTQPDSGTAIVSANQVEYTPGAGFAGYDTLYYQVCDNGTPVLCDTAMVVILVSPFFPNRAPEAFNDSSSVCENSQSNLLDVQGNDFDWNGDSLATFIVNGPKSGSAQVQGKQISYTPASGFSGYDTIRYSVCDFQLCDTAYLFIYVQAGPLVSAGPDREIVFGDSVQVGTLPVPGHTYRWSSGATLSSDTVAMPFADPEVTTHYTLTQTMLTTGCSNTDEVVVVVSGDGFYNALSPNGDGVNDYWMIPALNKYPQNEVVVINRYGSEVWKAQGYDNSSTKFTGTNQRGDALPDGTYFYVITYNNTKKEGWVAIKR